MKREQAFVIMPIGNPQIDEVFDRAISPALRLCGLDPKRVDRELRAFRQELEKRIRRRQVLLAE